MKLRRKRKLSCLWLAFFLLFSLSGCKIESVEEHQKGGEKIQDKTTASTDKEKEKEQAKTSDNKDNKNNKETSDTTNKKTTKKSDTTTNKEKPTQNGSTKPSDKGTTQPSNPQKPTPTTPKKKYVTISIDVKTILKNKDKLKENKKAYVPADGWILRPTKVEIKDGDSVFDVLERITRSRRIHMEYQGANQNIYNSVYIQGINQLYEFDCGDLSGWMYSINDAYVSVGASVAKVKDGQVIKWMYTCDLGKDINLKL